MTASGDFGALLREMSLNEGETLLVWPGSTASVTGHSCLGCQYSRIAVLAEELRMPLLPPPARPSGGGERAEH